MIKIQSFLVFFLFVSLVKAQIGGGNCDISDSLYISHYPDMFITSVRQAEKHQVDCTDSIIVPDWLLRSNLKVLLAIENSGLPVFDTLIKVRNKQNLDWKKVVFSADSNLSWMQHLKNKDSLSGNMYLDSLMKKYGLKVSDYEDRLNTPEHWVFLQSDTPINTNALCRALLLNADIATADIFPINGDGDFIKIDNLQVFSTVIYSIGWEDCPLGCIKRRYWEFRVFPDCNVEFKGSYGDIMSDKTINAESHVMKIFPNPVHENLTIESEQISGRVHFKITDYTGRILYENENEFNHKLSIPVESLNVQNGIYLIQLTDETGLFYQARFLVN